MKRLVLFAAFDKDGVVDDYVVHYVKALSEFAQVIYVADNEMKVGELEKLSPFVLKAFRPPRRIRLWQLQTRLCLRKRVRAAC